jgi:hypothetical protein
MIWADKNGDVRTLNRASCDENNMDLQMKYFVLKPAGNDLFALASRRAMRVYAETVAKEHPDFANQIREWVNREIGKSLQQT